MGEPVHLIHKYSVDEAKVAAVKKRVTGGTELMYCNGVERIAINDSGPRKMVNYRTQLVTSLAGWRPGEPYTIELLHLLLFTSSVTHPLTSAKPPCSLRHGGLRLSPRRLTEAQGRRC